MILTEKNKKDLAFIITKLTSNDELWDYKEITRLKTYNKINNIFENNNSIVVIFKIFSDDLTTDDIIIAKNIIKNPTNKEVTMYSAEHTLVARFNSISHNMNFYYDAYIDTTEGVLAADVKIYGTLENGQKFKTKYKKSYPDISQVFGVLYTYPQEIDYINCNGFYIDGTQYIPKDDKLILKKGDYTVGVIQDNIEYLDLANEIYSLTDLESDNRLFGVGDSYTIDFKFNINNIEYAIYMHDECYISVIDDKFKSEYHFYNQEIIKYIRSNLTNIEDLIYRTRNEFAHAIRFM